MRKFRNEGHNVTIVFPSERRYNEPIKLSIQDGIKLLSVKTLNIQKTNIIEKGFGTLLLEYQFHSAIKRDLGKEHFDLVIYSTPPITLTKIIKSLKRKYSSKTYLLLKDIFPQNAVDLKMMSSKSLLYKYFRNKEKQLYKLSDYIGCMSPANVVYLIRHNPVLNTKKIEVCPNSIELNGSDILINNRTDILKSHHIPDNKTIFIYGGNLGKPQGIDFLIKVLESNYNNDSVFFIIVGSGTEYLKVQTWFGSNRPNNAKLLPGLPKKEYDELIQACDVGLIFLDKRFTIPNFPSRLLSYLENKMPVLAATDINTDVGTIAEENGFGFKCISGDNNEFNRLIAKFSDRKTIKEMGEKGYSFLKMNYTVEQSYRIIMSQLELE
jgi:glycosyltransferase involved in cell wall biosynthesis